MYWMTEQILSLPLHVFIIIVNTLTYVAMYLPYYVDLLALSLMKDSVY